MRQGGASRRVGAGIGLLVALLVGLSGSPGVGAAQSGPDALRPGDVVRLAISGEETLTGDYAVDASGSVSLPLIGTRSATTMPADRLRQEILDAYNAQFRNQSIQVTVLRRIRVLGAVQNPGLYHADPTMTVADIVALAGGPTEQGRLDQVRLVRDGREIEARLDSPVAMQLQSGDQILVPERSWFARNTTWVIGLAMSTVAIITRILY